MTGGGALASAILAAARACRGQFVCESGHHGDLWLEAYRRIVVEFFPEPPGSPRTWGQAYAVARSPEARA